MNRRNFIQTAAFAALGGSLLSEQTFAKQKIKSPGIQLYTVRNELGKDFEGTLKAVAALGYKEFEFFGNYYGKDPKAVRTMLAGMGVTAPAGHFGLAALKTDVNKVIDTAKAAGHGIVICPFLMPNERKTLDDYKKLCDVLNKSGEACKKAGLTFGYHNHDFEFQMLEGKLPYDLILAECDKNTVKMEMDLGWISHAGKDPLEYFAQASRTFHHLPRERHGRQSEANHHGIGTRQSRFQTHPRQEQIGRCETLFCRAGQHVADFTGKH